MPVQDLSAFTPEIWSKRIITRLDQINVMLRLVNRDYEGDIRDQGDTVWVRTYGNVTLAPYKRGGDIEYGVLVPTKESLVINDAQSFAFQVDDLDQAQNDLRALDGYSQRAAVALNNAVEAKCLSFYAKANAANQINATNAAVGAAIDGPHTSSAGNGTGIIVDNTNAYTLLVEANRRLDLLNAPAGNRWAVVGPTFKASLMADSKYFIRSTDLGDQIVTAGRISMKANSIPNFVGQAAGFNVFWSNALPSDANGTYLQYGAGTPISYAGQIRKLEQIRRESTFADAVRGLLLHDGTVFNENAKEFGYILASAA